MVLAACLVARTEADLNTAAFLLSAPANQVRFQGTAYQGLDEDQLRVGGSTITAQLLGSELTYNTTLTSTGSFKAALIASITAANANHSTSSVAADDNTWSSCIAPALDRSRIVVSNGAHLLKVILGPAPMCTVGGLLNVHVSIPSSALSTPHGEWPASLTGPNVVIIPKSKVSFTNLAEDGLVVSGRTATLQLVGDASDLPANPRFDVVEGPSCRSARPAVVEDKQWDPATMQLTFRPLLGGTLSVCYTPFDGLPGVVVRANGAILVNGPEGLTTEPSNPRAQIEFSGMIYGTNLTDQDMMVITAEASCANVQGDVDNFDTVISSPARALFWASVPVQGLYQVCYQRLGSDRFVRVGSIVMNKGSELIVDKDMPQLLIDQDALVVRNTRISFLTLQQGQLNLDNFQLNITHFVWTGGQLLGSGSLNCMGTNSKIAGLTDTRVIEGIVRNFGYMEVDMRHLVFSGRGSLFNYGEMVLLVNSSGPDDAATIQAVGRGNLFVNGVSGKITIRFIGSGGALHVAIPFENRGTLTIAPNGMVVMQDMVLAVSGYTHLLHYSMLMVRSGKFFGHVTTTEESELRLLGDALLRRLDLEGRGLLSVVSGRCIMDAITSNSEMEFVFDGTIRTGTAQADPVTVQLSGTSTFGPGTRTMLRRVSFEANDALAKLIFGGKLVCHVPSVVFGSNIVVQSNLAAVMFGDGEDEGTQRAKLIPQRMPQNSSFVVPPNATLVIMNTGNLTQTAIDTLKSPPRICSTYVVVPMHVEVDGTVLLWGCAMLPFGVTVNGIIYGTNAKEIEATVEYAFCRSVLMNPRVCVPLFPAQETVPPTGLSVSGPFVVAKPLSKEIIAKPARGTSADRGPTINVDYIDLQDAGLVAHDAFSLLSYKRIDIDGGSTMVLTNGGLFGTSNMRLNGGLQLQGNMPLVLHGTLEVGPTGYITIDVDTTTCSLPLQVSESADFHPDSQLRCVAALNRSVGSAGLLAFGALSGHPALDATTCALNGHEVAVRLTGDMDRLGLRFVDVASDPNDRQRIVLLMVTLGVGLCVFALLAYLLDLSPSKMLCELKKECALSLHLSWPEFSSYAANTMVVGGFLMESIFFSMPAFHASLPLPLEVSYLIRTSMNFMLPHRNASAPMLTAIAVILIGTWFMLWIPLSGKRLSHMVKNLITNPDSSLQRKMIQFLFQSHSTLCFAFGLVMFPVLTHLLEAVACRTFFAHVSSCEAIAPLGSASMVAACMFMVLVPYSANCLNFPFGHPPYHQTLDLRFKRSFSVLHMMIVFVQVASWKIFANDPVTLLWISAVLVCTLGSLVWHARPCAYANMNLMRFVSLLIPLWAIFTGLVQVMRFGADSKFVCAAGDPLYVVMLFVGKAVLVVVAVYSTRRCSSDYDSLSNDPVIDTSMKALTMTYYQIEDLRVEMYNTTRSTRREVISNNIAKLRIEYLEKLRMFRISKERYLLPYYLGECARAQSSTHGHGSSSRGHPGESEDEMLSFHPNSAFSIQDPVKPNTTQFTTTNGSPLDPAAAGGSSPQVFEGEADWILNPDEMDRFHCGPQLGRGSYGTVHMGMLPSGKLVAVKVIQIVRKKKDQLNAVKLEVNMLRSLNHPNIIRYFGCHATQGEMRVFMEFAVGGSLTSLVRKFEKLSEPVMRYYTHQILTGLLFLHSRHVVHRDIKGENILIDGHGVAKLADFGCSKGLADIANKSQNGCGTLVGSPYWMAPEVIKNEAYGTKADIWSVGCTVVEMLNGGHPPWHEKFDNVYSAMFFIASTSEIPSNIPNDVSDTCRDFLARCFERDVAKRSSTQELLNHPWLHDLPTSHDSNSSGSNHNTPKIERQWSDMFETDSNTHNTTSQTSTHTGEGTSEPTVADRTARMRRENSGSLGSEQPHCATADGSSLSKEQSTFL